MNGTAQTNEKPRLMGTPGGVSHLLEEMIMPLRTALG
jgi:hypothetical protein